MLDRITFRLSDIKRLVSIAKELGWDTIVEFLNKDSNYCLSISKIGKYDYEIIRTKNGVTNGFLNLTLPTELDSLKLDAIIFNTGHRVEDYEL